MRKAVYGQEVSQIQALLTEVYGMTVDGAPFVGPVPGAEGQFMSAGYGGHGEFLAKHN